MSSKLIREMGLPASICAIFAARNIATAKVIACFVPCRCTSEQLPPRCTVCSAPYTCLRRDSRLKVAGTVDLISFSLLKNHIFVRVVCYIPEMTLC